MRMWRMWRMINKYFKIPTKQTKNKIENTEKTTLNENYYIKLSKMPK